RPLSVICSAMQVSTVFARRTWLARFSPAWSPGVRPAGHVARPHGDAAELVRLEQLRRLRLEFSPEGGLVLPAQLLLLARLELGIGRRLFFARLLDLSIDPVLRAQPEQVPLPLEVLDEPLGLLAVAEDRVQLRRERPRPDHVRVALRVEFGDATPVLALALDPLRPVREARLDVLLPGVLVDQEDATVFRLLHPRLALGNRNLHAVHPEAERGEPDLLCTGFFGRVLGVLGAGVVVR